MLHLYCVSKSTWVIKPVINLVLLSLDLIVSKNDHGLRNCKQTYCVYKIEQDLMCE